MKFKILTICFAIILTGNYNLYHQVIAEKYDKYLVDDVVIEMVDELTKTTFLSAEDQKTNVGRVYWNMSFTKPERIEVVNNYYGLDFERVLLHEFAHYTFASKNEKLVDNYAKYMVGLVNNLR